MSMFSGVTDFFTEDWTNLLYLTPLAPVNFVQKTLAFTVLGGLKGFGGLFDKMSGMMSPAPPLPPPVPSKDPVVKRQFTSLMPTGNNMLRVDVPRTPGMATSIIPPGIRL
ncbi:MAG: hypothetical protein WC683_06980 [bacterium]